MNKYNCRGKSSLFYAFYQERMFDINKLIEYFEYNNYIYTPLCTVCTIFNPYRFVRFLVYNLNGE